MPKNFVSYGDAETLMAGVEERIEKNYFEGTEDEWNNLTDEQKAVYDGRPLFIRGDDAPIDLSGYQRKALTTPITIGGVQQNYVEGALGALNTAKGDKSVLDNEIATRSALGAKNLLPFPYSGYETITENGLTYTINEDYSITIQGTASAECYFLFVLARQKFNLPDGNYILTSKGVSPSIITWVNEWQNGAYKRNLTWASDPDIDYPFTIDTSGFDSLEIGITIYQNAVINTTIYPMIRLASDTDDTYQPFAMTNQQLTGDMIYSTSEVDTGKVWINGKKIYRTVLSGTTNAGSSGDTTITTQFTNVIPNNFETIVSISGVMDTPISSGKVPRSLNYFANTSDYIMCHVGTTVNNVFYQGGFQMRTPNVSHYSQSPFRAIIEYTKTT